MVFTKYILCDDPVINVVEDGEVVGFQFKMQQPQYRGLFLSCVLDIKVIVDGEEFSGDQITFTISNGTFGFDNLMTHGFHRWNFGERGVITVKKPGGLAKGPHHMEAGIKIRSSQDNSIGGYGTGADGYTGGYRDFVIE